MSLLSPGSRVAPDEDGIRRDQWGRYVWPHPETGIEQSWTRATTFAKTISDTYKLDMWGRRMTARGLTLRKDILAMVAATPDDEKDRLDGLCKEAADAAAARAGSNLGTALHTFTERMDRGEDVLIPDPWDADVGAYQATMVEAGLRVLPEYIERMVCNTGFKEGVGGKFDRIVECTKDCVASFKSGQTALLTPGDRLIFDLKTGRDLQYGWGEIVVQLYLYASAATIWDRFKEEHLPMPRVRQDVGLVLHLPAGAAQATLYAIDLREGMRAAQLCEQIRQWRKNRTLAAQLMVSETGTPTLPPVFTVREPTWAERISEATSRGELTSLWRQAQARGEWDESLTVLSKERVAELSS